MIFTKKKTQLKNTTDFIRVFAYLRSDGLPTKYKQDFLCRLGFIYASCFCTELKCGASEFALSLDVPVLMDFFRIGSTHLIPYRKLTSILRPVSP